MTFLFTLVFQFAAIIVVTELYSPGGDVSRFKDLTPTGVHHLGAAGVHNDVSRAGRLVLGDISRFDYNI